MRAFLSHSSKHKSFVGQVAKVLGDSQCEYDERTFEYTLNVRAIRNALERSDMAVFFLSSHSVSSTFITEEERQALEARGKGFIKRVMIFALDETSYRALPDWLRDINVVQRLSSPKACARKIQAALIRLEAEEDSGADIYVGRETEDSQLRRVLSGAPANTPNAIHAVGHYGVGRKTFLRRNLAKLFPRRFDSFVEVALSQNQGVEELYRQLYDLVTVSSIEDTIANFEAFSKLASGDQFKRIAGILKELGEAGEFLLLTDDGGIYTDEGDYQPHLKGVLSIVDGRAFQCWA